MKNILIYPTFRCGVNCNYCAWTLQPDGKSVRHRCSEKDYSVDKELTATQLTELLRPIENDVLYEFTGGEPLRFNEIQEVLKVLPNWSITSNTLHDIGNLDLTNCRLWQASFHPALNEVAKEKFFNNINHIRSLKTPVGITLVVQPETVGRTIDWMNIFLKAGFNVVIHLYHEDPQFNWEKYPLELKKLEETGRVAYGNIFYNWDTKADNKLCRGGKDYIVIAPDGKKFRCVIDMILSRKPIDKHFDDYRICHDSCPMGCDHVRGGLDH